MSPKYKYEVHPFKLILFHATLTLIFGYTAFGPPLFLHTFNSCTYILLYTDSMWSKIAVLGFVTQVIGHGHITGIVADGIL